VKQPFFIVGTGRSGTTLLYHLLESHERVALTNEARVADFLFFCTEFVTLPAYAPRRFALQKQVELNGIVGRPYVDSFAQVFREHAVAALTDFYETWFAHKQFTHWGDKLPEAETANALRTLFPHTKFLVLARDPRDVFCSVRGFGRKPEVQAVNPFLGEQTLEEHAEYWRNVYQGFVEYFEHRLELRYEELVRDPRGVMARVLDFLGLEPSAAHAAAMAQNDSFRGHGTATSPEASIGRWREELSADEAQHIERVCGGLMRRFGYEL
jgi:hypothetical protein